jgi:aprataxin
MSALTILRAYAKQTDLSVLPPTILLASTATTLTIFDKFPKAQLHLLVIPRLPAAHPDLSTGDLGSLQSLLSSPQKRPAARALVESLKREGESAKEMIRAEMKSRFGYMWDVWMGFHAAPSMQYVLNFFILNHEIWRKTLVLTAIWPDVTYFISCCFHLERKRHIHLHVISSDLCSPSLKHKKHYNSFHPKLGFFLHVNEVLSWFDAKPSFFDSVRNFVFTPPPSSIHLRLGTDRFIRELSTFQMAATLKDSKYEALLKENLVCWRCHSEFKNFPQLKAHLQGEWDNEAEREKNRKRKRDESMQGRKAIKMSSSDHPAKRTDIDE